MKRLFTCCLAFACLFSACKNDPKPVDWSAKDIRLICQDAGSTEEAPAFALYLQVADRKSKVAEISSTCDVIGTEEYAAYEIPAEAKFAAGGWWAGAGNYYYVIAEGNTLAVYHAIADEMQEEPGYSYRRIAVYEGGKFRLESEGM